MKQNKEIEHEVEQEPFANEPQWVPGGGVDASIGLETPQTIETKNTIRTVKKMDNERERIEMIVTNNRGDLMTAKQLVDFVIAERKAAYDDGYQQGKAEADLAEMDEGEIKRQAQIDVLEELKADSQCNDKFSDNGCVNDGNYCEYSDICRKLQELKLKSEVQK